MSDSNQRPENVTNQHLEFLDHLRDTGITNMFGAGPFLSREFLLNKKEASEILGYWMNSFGNEDR